MQICGGIIDNFGLVSMSLGSRSLADNHREITKLQITHSQWLSSITAKPECLLIVEGNNSELLKLAF